MKIQLTLGLFTTIDEENFEKIDKYHWYAKKMSDTLYYAAASIDGKHVKMHQFLMGEEEGKIIDHENGDGLDNREGNLRFITQKRNSRNNKISKNNSSGITGVGFDKARNKWKAQIMVDYKSVQLGRFNTKEEAIEVRRKAELEYFGEYSTNRVVEKIETKKSKPRRNKTCKNKYEGVSYSRKRWRVRFNYDGERKYIGHFDTEIEAAKCYIEEYERVYGEKPYEI